MHSDKLHKFPHRVSSMSDEIKQGQEFCKASYTAAAPRSYELEYVLVPHATTCSPFTCKQVEMKMTCHHMNSVVTLGFTARICGMQEIRATQYLTMFHTLWSCEQIYQVSCHVQLIDCKSHSWSTTYLGRSDLGLT